MSKIVKIWLSEPNEEKALRRFFHLILLVLYPSLPNMAWQNDLLASYSGYHHNQWTILIGILLGNRMPKNGHQFSQDAQESFFPKIQDPLNSGFLDNIREVGRLAKGMTMTPPPLPLRSRRGRNVVKPAASLAQPSGRPAQL